METGTGMTGVGKEDTMIHEYAMCMIIESPWFGHVQREQDFFRLYWI